MLVINSVIILLAATVLTDASTNWEQALEPIPAQDVKAEDALEILKGHLEKGNLSAFISQTQKIKSSVATATLDDTKLMSILDMIWEMDEVDPTSKNAKIRIFRAFSGYYKVSCKSVDKLAGFVLDEYIDILGDRMDTALFEPYVIELAKETDYLPASIDGPEKNWLNDLEEFLDTSDPRALSLLQKVRRQVLMNQTRKALAKFRRKGPTAAIVATGQGYCLRTSIRKNDPLYEPITEEHRQEFINYLIDEMDMEALRDYLMITLTPVTPPTTKGNIYGVDLGAWESSNCENGSLLQNDKSNLKILDATMTLMSFAGSPSAATNAPGAPNAGSLPVGRPGNAILGGAGARARASGPSTGSKNFSSLVDANFRGLALSYKKPQISEFSKQLCAEITDFSTDNFLKFLLFQTLHPDQSIAELLRNEFFLKVCDAYIKPDELNDKVEAFANTNQSSNAILGDLVGRSFMNIDDILIEKEIQELVKAIETPSSLAHTMGGMAPTLFKELRPETTKMFTRIIEAGKKSVEKLKDRDLTTAQTQLKAKAKAIIAKLPANAYKEGMILDVLTASFNEGNFPFFEVLCPKSQKKCKDFPLKLLERFQETMVLKLDANNGKPNKITAELLATYREFLESLHSKIKAQHPTQAKSTGASTSQQAESSPQAALMKQLMEARGGKKSQVLAQGLNDVKGILEDYDLDLPRALELLQGKALNPLRMDLIEWRSQELLDNASAKDEDLLSTLLVFAVQLKDLAMMHQVISKPGLSQSFQFTQGFQVLIASILLSLAGENCLEAPAISLRALGIDIEPLTPLPKNDKCKETDVNPNALPQPTKGEAPKEFLALHPKHEPSIAEDLLQVICNQFNCPFHRIEKQYMPKIFPWGAAPDAAPKLKPPMDGFAEQWLHSMDRLIDTDKEVAEEYSDYKLKTPLYTFFESTIKILVQYMTLDPEVAKELISFIMQKYSA